MKTNLTLFFNHQAEVLCKVYGVDIDFIQSEMESFLSQYPEALTTDLIQSAVNFLATSIIETTQMPLPHIPFSSKDITPSLSFSDKKIIRTILKEYCSSRTNFDVGSLYNIDPSVMKPCSCSSYLYSQLLHESPEDRKAKIFYAFSYILNRPLNELETEYLNTLLQMYEDNFEYMAAAVYLFEYEKAFFSKNPRTKPASQEWSNLYNFFDETDLLFEFYSEQYYIDLLNQTGYSCLFDKLLDTIYQDIIFSYVGILYEDSNTNIQTYTDFLSNYLNDSNIDSEYITVLIRNFCESMSTYITRNIYGNDEHTTYYRENRGPKKINNNFSVPHCKKDIMQLIFFSRKKTKENYGPAQYDEKIYPHIAVPYESYSVFYNNIKKISKERLFPHLKQINDDDLYNYQEGYRLFLKYFNCEKEQPKGNTLKKEMTTILFFINNAKRYFDHYSTSETNWFNYNSLFIKEWDFLTYASYIYNHRIKENAFKQSEISPEDYIADFITYCHEIKYLSYPHLQHELLDDPAFFEEFLYSDTWLISLYLFLDFLETLTGYVISNCLELKKHAFSSSQEELLSLYEILSYYKYDKNLQTDITQENIDELTEFMSLYLPTKSN